MNLAAVEIEAFVPAQDFERSKQFFTLFDPSSVLWWPVLHGLA